MENKVANNQAGIAVVRNLKNEVKIAEARLDYVVSVEADKVIADASEAKLAGEHCAGEALQQATILVQKSLEAVAAVMKCYDDGEQKERIARSLTSGLLNAVDGLRRRDEEAQMIRKMIVEQLSK